MVPQGGLFWDGRVNTLQSQALGPLLNPVEMANRDMDSVAAKLRKASYADSFAQLFGATILNSPGRLVDEALFAVARYQVEDVSFHPYTSKYDYWLEGKARLTDTELRGLRLFEDKGKANCAGCHLDRPSKDGQPPLFTDYQYEALGVPRNARSRSTMTRATTTWVCAGRCAGPGHPDPVLRHVPHPHAAQHRHPQGVLPQRRLSQARRTYWRSTISATCNPDKIYPEAADGRAMKFDDLPEAYLPNMDVVDPPFDRKLGQPPAMSKQDMRDIVAFLEHARRRLPARGPARRALKVPGVR